MILAKFQDQNFTFYATDFEAPGHFFINIGLHFYHFLAFSLNQEKITPTFKNPLKSLIQPQPPTLYKNKQKHPPPTPPYKTL